MAHRFFDRLRGSRTPEAGTHPKQTRDIGREAVASFAMEQFRDDEPVNEALVVGSVRLQALTSAVAAAEGPAPDTYFHVPSTVETTTFAHTVLPDNLPEGAPVEQWAVELPVDKFVEAPDFVNWHDGRDGKKNGMSSKKKIRQYARMPGRTAAPITHVIVYMQPNGKVFCGLAGDGAHRLAAAKLRGDESIYARDVVFAKLHEDLL